MTDPAGHPPQPTVQEPSLEARVAGLEAALAAVSTRLAALEAGAPLPQAAASTPAAAAPQAAVPAAASAAPEPPPALPSGVQVMGLVGKVCLVLGGGYFIRMLAEAGRLPNTASVALGLAYAITWALLALRARQRMVASFDTLSSILIAYPLLVESTVRFHWLAPEAAALLLLAVAVLHQVLAWRKDLQPMAWLGTLGAVGSSLVMLAATHALEPFLAVLLALGLGLQLLTAGRRWQGLRWPAALAVDLGVLALAWLAGWVGGPPEGYRHLSAGRAVLFSLALPLGYLGCFAWRTLGRRARLDLFAWAQTLLVLVCGFGGAFRITLSQGAGAGGLGVVALATGLAAYGTGFRFATEEGESRSSFDHYLIVGALLLLLGGAVLAPLPVFAALAGIAGLASFAAALRLPRPILRVQAGVYLLAAGGGSGLFPWTFRTFFDPSGSLVAPGLAALVVLGLLLVLPVLLLARSSESSAPTGLGTLASLSLGFGILGLGALAVWGLGPAAGADRMARVALLRTGTLAVLILALARSARHVRALDLRWVVYPVLALATLKFLFEDFAVGQPMTLFLAFMFLGATFILAPRFLKVNP